MTVGALSVDAAKLLTSAYRKPKNINRKPTESKDTYCGKVFDPFAV